MEQARPGQNGMISAAATYAKIGSEPEGGTGYAALPAQPELPMILPIPYPTADFPVAAAHCGEGSRGLCYPLRASLVPEALRMESMFHFKV